MENPDVSQASTRWRIALALVTVVVTLAVVIWLLVRRKSPGRNGEREPWQDRFDLETRNASRCPDDTLIATLKAMIGSSSSSAAIEARAYLDECSEVNRRLVLLSNLQLSINQATCQETDLVNLGRQVNDLKHPHPAVSERVATLQVMIDERMRTCSLHDANRAIDDLKSETSSASMIMTMAFLVGIVALTIVLGKKFFGKSVGTKAQTPNS